MAKDNIQKDEYAIDLANYLLALINRKENFNVQKSITLTETIPLPNINKSLYDNQQPSFVEIH